MFEAQDKILLREVAQKFGEESRWHLLQEELAELIVAISHHFRDRDPHQVELTIEMVDVMIMIQQCMTFMNRDYVLRRKYVKMHDLEKLLREGESK